MNLLKNLKLLVCSIVGHNYHNGLITLALSLQPKNDTWYKVTHSAEIMICKRCEQVPFIGTIVVGEYDANIGFNPTYSIDNFRVLISGKITNEIIFNKV